MNIAACNSVPASPLTSAWFRAVDITRLQQPFDFDPKHTRAVRSRFNPGPLLLPNEQYRALYLCEDQDVAAAEFGALFAHPSGFVTRPNHSWGILSVNVKLQKVVDLTQWNAINALQTSFQELTGDWLQYDGSFSSQMVRAPTQYLGQAFFECGVEGIITFSAKRPTKRNLVVFPDRGQPGSSVRFYNQGIAIFDVPMP